MSDTVKVLPNSETRLLSCDAYIDAYMCRIQHCESEPLPCWMVSVMKQFLICCSTLNIK